MDDLDQQQEVLRQKTFLLMFRILLVFGIPAALAYFLGQWIDTRFDMKPYGTLLVLAVAFVSSWTVTIKTYLKVDRDFRAIRLEREARERGEENKKEKTQ